MTGLVAIHIVGGLLLLIVGGEFLVRGASRLAASLGVPSVIIGLTVVAFGTSTPELAVSFKAALAGSANIAVANVVGSNIFNTLFILGLSALVSPLIIHSQMIRREVPIMIGVSLLLYLLSLGGEISRMEGLLLFAGIVSYTTWLVLEARQNRKEDRPIVDESEKIYGSLKDGRKAVVVAVALVVGGLAIVMWGADLLVDGAVAMAKNLGVSDTVIGLTIVAAGTSLPEVVASLVATIKGERDIAVGNVVGSNLYNILAIIGITGAASPSGLAVGEQLLNFDIPLMIASAVLCWPFFKTGKRLSRLEGGVFLVGYIAYTTYLVLHANTGVAN